MWALKDALRPKLCGIWSKQDWPNTKAPTLSLLYFVANIRKTAIILKLQNKNNLRADHVSMPDAHCESQSLCTKVLSLVELTAVSPMFITVSSLTLPVHPSCAYNCNFSPRL